MKRGQTPDQYQNPGQPEIVNPIVREVTGTEAEYSMLSYRVGGIDSEDAMMADLVSSVLAMAKQALLTNLNTSQKVLRAYLIQSFKGLHMLTLGVTPREGQTLDEAMLCC